MICPYIVSISLLLGSIIFWGIMWSYIKTKQGDWYMLQTCLLAVCTVFKGTRCSNDMYKCKKKDLIVPVACRNMPKYEEAGRFNVCRRNQFFLKDQISMWTTVLGYLVLVIISILGVSMNFLLRSTHPATPVLPSVPEIEPYKDVQPMTEPATTLAGLIAEDTDTNSSSDDGEKDGDGLGDGSGTTVGSVSKSREPFGKHADVTDDEGCIMIPYKELPKEWTDASDILEIRSLDRSFVFPGEQIHILVCLKESKQETKVTTPFKVAAVISKNGNSAHSVLQPEEVIETNSSAGIEQSDVNDTHEGADIQGLEESDGITSTSEMGLEQDLPATESLLWIEDHKQKTETLLERFRNSNFFVKIAKSDDQLWCRRRESERASADFETVGPRFQFSDAGSRETSKGNLLNTVIDRGSFDGNSCGGAARSTARCYSLRNGDIVVLLQVNIANNVMKDPVLEVLQFEKYDVGSSSENLSGFLDDPCHDILNWLLPLDRTLPSPHPLSPPVYSASVLASASHKVAPVSASSQLFSFGHFRSYSMPTLPQSTPPSAVTSSIAKPTFDLEDLSRFSLEKLKDIPDTGNDALLSFRGVPLVPDRFSAHCGLEGIYLPGRRWRRKLEIIQPIEIHSFTSQCATEDLLCVQIKNVSPSHIPDIVVFLDAITIVFEEASKGGAPQSLPIASIETGNGENLPNLALRKGEEHSFILKPSTTIARDQKGPNNTSSRLSHSKIGVPAPSMHMTSRASDATRLSPTANQYAVLVSCRCNYTESKLFFKKPISWQPRVARDLMISVASEKSKQTTGPYAEAPRLPVQELTLQASNMTSDDLTLTVVAPISSNSTLSVLSLNSGPTTPMSPSVGFPEFTRRMSVDKHGTCTYRLSSLSNLQENQKEKTANDKSSIFLGGQPGVTSDIISSTVGCTHLWLQSTVPLGCVPAHSTATVKLEVLPLADGILTLDTLQVAVKEKGQMYRPEQPLKISVPSSTATGVE